MSAVPKLGLLQGIKVRDGEGGIIKDGERTPSAIVYQLAHESLFHVVRCRYESTPYLSKKISPQKNVLKSYFFGGFRFFGTRSPYCKLHFFM